MLKTPLGRLRLMGNLEGASFLILLGIAMPLKYKAGLPEAVLIVGWLHGLLFVLYILAVSQAATVFKWGMPLVVGALAASILPFGPFVFDAYLRRHPQFTVAPSSTGGDSSEPQ